MGKLPHEIHPPILLHRIEQFVHARLNAIPQPGDDGRLEDHMQDPPHPRVVRRVVFDETKGDLTYLICQIIFPGMG